jgi:hypothetical protein
MTHADPNREQFARVYPRPPRNKTTGAGEPSHASAGEVRRTSGPPSDDPQRAWQLALAPAPADPEGAR